MEIKINVNKHMLFKLFIGLVLIEITFVIGYFAAAVIPINKLYKIFNLDGESTIPSWFSSMQLFLIGLIFWTKSIQPNNFPFIPPIFFRAVGAGFIYLSADEACQFHEKIGNTLRVIDNGTNVIPHFEGGNGHGFWLLPYFLIVISLVLIFVKDIIAFFKYYKHSAIVMICGLSISILGAVGFEIIGYGLRDSNQFLPYIFEVAAEEFFEMLGFSLFLYGATLMLIGEKNNAVNLIINSKSAETLVNH